MTNLRIHPEVADDLEQAKSWYLEIDPELTESFLAEAYSTMELAQVAPEQYSRIYEHYRRVLCQRFPYKIVFEIDEIAQAVHILAVSHTSQHPDRWKRRI
ncbi:MAG: type II toxin-antitoxin system RelE/ParE family toxin [Verrucomicrobiales bacterium]|nr:type II toxin-antitoxin system RelE/ParE family toxin [Verrucomicrobiales bacterium]